MMSDDQQLTLARLGSLSVHLLDIELARPTKEERELFMQVDGSERCTYAWMLIIQNVKPLRKTMDHFSYDRYVELVEEGLQSVQELQSCLNFQFPYVYMHMLTFMVNCANFLAAVGTGVTLGVLFARENETHNGAFVFPDINRIQNEVILLLVQSLFYQSFLSIGASLSYPLSAGDKLAGKRAYSIPLGQMCAMLEQNLALINNVGDDTAETPLSSPATSPSQPESLPKADGGRA